MSEYTITMELEAMATLFLPQVHDIARIHFRGFRDGVPPNMKLWDIPPVDASKHACDAATFQENLDFFAEQIKANKEQIEATKKSFDAPSGVSLIHGDPSTGKTTLSLLQALTAASIGHKVVICGPSRRFFTIRDKFHEHKPLMPGGREPKIYTAESPWLKELVFIFCKLAQASKTSGDDKPITLEHEVWNILQENLRILETPEMQTLYNSPGEQDAILEPLLDSQNMWDLMLKLRSQSDPDKEDERKFRYLYNKLYFRVISEADIIISSCHDAGVPDLIRNFRPTVAIVDDCNLTNDGEAFVPLLLYNDVQIRILIGDKNVVRPHSIYDPHPPQYTTTILERWGGKGVPVHELQIQNPRQTNPADTQSQGIGNAGKIARNKPCLCGSRKKYKKCCGADE